MLRFAEVWIFLWLKEILVLLELFLEKDFFWFAVLLVEFKFSFELFYFWCFLDDNLFELVNIGWSLLKYPVFLLLHRFPLPHPILQHLILPKKLWYIFFIKRFFELSMRKRTAIEIKFETSALLNKVFFSLYTRQLAML